MVDKTNVTNVPGLTDANYEVKEIKKKKYIKLLQIDLHYKTYILNVFSHIIVIKLHVNKNKYYGIMKFNILFSIIDCCYVITLL